MKYLGSRKEETRSKDIALRRCSRSYRSCRAHALGAACPIKYADILRRRQAAEHLESLGAVVEEVSLPTFDKGLPAYYVIALSEASSNLSRYDGVRYGRRVGADNMVEVSAPR